MPGINGATFYLELVINGRGTGKVLPVSYRDGHYYTQAGPLLDAGVRLQADPGAEVAVDAIEGVRAVYNGNAQQLQLTLPLDWLPNQIAGTTASDAHIPAISSLGALFNYDIYTSDVSGPGGWDTSAWLEQRVFDGFGFISNTGVYRHDQGGGHSGKHGYMRYDTSWRFNDEDRMLSYAAGDITTGSLAWTGAVRVGGVQIQRNFGLRPELVTYPLPQFSGEAAVPSAVDLYINGYKSSSTDLQPGPYTINSVPFINGAGEATVVTRDALGRQVSVSVPFYVTSTMLKTGLSDYSLSVGALRQNYGVRSFDYGKAVASGSFRYGMSDWFTFESHAEVAPHLGMAGLGGNIALGRLGTLNVAYAQSQYRGGSGRQYTAGYSYYARAFGVAAQHLQRSAGYMDLSRYSIMDAARDFAVPMPIRSAIMRRSDQITGSVTLGRAGSLGAGYFDARSSNGERTRLVNLSYTRSLWRGSSLYASINRDLGASGYSAQLQLLVPLGNDNGTLTFDTTRDRDHHTSARATYSRVTPVEGGWGWNLAYAGGTRSYRQADVTWRGPNFQVQGGAFGAPGNYTRWADLSGSVVWMDGGLFATNTITDAFALISTDGYSGVPVSYENQVRGVTDRNGHLLVPSVSSYYPGKFAIDPLNLPADVDVPEVEGRIAVRQGSGALLRFPIRRVLTVNVSLVDDSGKPLPRGLIVHDLDSGRQTFTGWDGLVYLEDVQSETRVRVDEADGNSCTALIVTDAGKEGQMTRPGPVTCAREGTP